MPPRLSPQRRNAAVLTALIVLTTGCGLKPAAKDALTQGSSGVGTLPTGADTSLGSGSSPAGALPGAGTTAGAPATGAAGSRPAAGGALTGGTLTAGTPTGGSTGRTTGGTTAGSSTTTTGGGGTTAGGTRTGTTPTSGTTGGQTTTASAPGTTTGISANEIRIGLHAPITGAAPLPASSFTSGAKRFWDDPKHYVNGKHVVVEVLDDKYKPSSARQVCEQMAAQDFLVVGAAGTDQIQACATDQVLRRANTPYLSAGVTTNGLTGLPNYFALSLTYKQQASAVMNNAKANGVPLNKVALVLTETPNFDDATAAAQQAVAAAGGSVIKVIRSPKSDSQSDGANTASELRASGATTVYFLTAPIYWINTVTAAAGQLYNPNYIGPGVTMGENTVAGVVCGSAPMTKANYLSPYVGFDKAQAGQGKDDTEFSVYGLSETIFQALSAAKGNLTRENFINTLQNTALPGGIYNPTVFKNSHFGGTKMHSLRLNCGSQSWVAGTLDPVSP